MTHKIYIKSIRLKISKRSLRLFVDFYCKNRRIIMKGLRGYNIKNEDCWKATLEKVLIGRAVGLIGEKCWQEKW